MRNLMSLFSLLGLRRILGRVHFNKGNIVEKNKQVVINDYFIARWKEY